MPGLGVEEPTDSDTLKSTACGADTTTDPSSPTSKAKGPLTRPFRFQPSPAQLTLEPEARSQGGGTRGSTHALRA
jgi:hypothetical protein